MMKIEHGNKNWLMIKTEDHLKKKNIGKGNTQEIDIGICLKKTDKY